MRITFAGGLNENEGADINECQDGENFDLYLGETDFKPRPPQDLKGTATLGGTIAGIMQMITQDDTETTLIFEDDSSTPTIYSWDGASTFTSKRTTNLAVGSKLRDIYYSLDDTLTIVDIAKLTPLMKWDGTNLTRHLTSLQGSSSGSVSSITRSGTTATVTTSGAHGLSTGDLAIIAGANETDYNIEAEITVTGSTTFTYTVAGSPSTPATGTITWTVGAEVFAKYGIVHNGRMWLFNVKVDSSDTPHLMVASAFEDIKTYDTSKRSGDSTFSTGNEAFYLLTPDLKPINGVVEFNKELVISTEGGKLYRLVGYDSSTYEFVDYYAGSNAIGTETLVNFGNDVAYMKRGGNIDTLRATDTSGDVSADDITRWIPDTISTLTDAISVYDQANQKILFFVSNKVLVLFKDHLYATQLSPWSVYTTQMTNSFNTSAARYLRRPGETTWSVYWGDSTGQIFDFNGSGAGDAGSTNIRTSRKTGLIEDPAFADGPMLGRVRYRRKGDCELTVEIDWSDVFATTDSVIGLKGPPAGDTQNYYNDSVYYGGDFYYNEGFEFSDNVSKQNFSPCGRGDSFTVKTEIDSTVDFRVDHVEIGA